MSTRRQTGWCTALGVGALLAGCATAPTGGPISQAPTVELDRVEVASYFPYAAPPARVPLALGFIFTITNPGDTTVLLEDFKFTVAFEGAPNEYFPLATPISYERLYTPPHTTNQLRVVTILDSLIVPGTLAVTSGYRLGALNLKAPDVVKSWWEQIGDFAYGIRVTEGTATFSSDGDTRLVTFDGAFPKR